MRMALIAFAALALNACGAREPHPYPQVAQARFHQSCPVASAVCVCTWEAITRAVTHEDYEAALARFREEGLMDPRITRARVRCIEKHGADD